MGGMECEGSALNRREIKFGSEPIVFNSLEHFLNDYRKDLCGNIEVKLGLPLHMYWLHRSSAVTLVTFSGATSPNIKHLPFYTGMNLARGLNANILMISDPTLLLSRDLSLAWYAGASSVPNLQRILTIIIERVCSGSRVILFGGSGGGYAALEQAIELPGSRAVVFNPQTSIFRYRKNAVLKYLHEAWGASNIDSFVPEFRSNILDAYERPVGTEVVYVQNVRDHFHMDYHYGPFRSISNSQNSVYYITPDLGEGHVGPDRDSLGRLLSLTIKVRRWKSLIKRLPSVEIARRVGASYPTSL